MEDNVYHIWGRTRFNRRKRVNVLRDANKSYDSHGGEWSARFKINEALPGIFHIGDELGVHCTLIVGRNEALLFDTGYGLFNIAAQVRSITSNPLRVILSHGHHDHACGAYQFDAAYVDQADIDVAKHYCAAQTRGRVLDQAKNILPADYDKDGYRGIGAGNLAALQENEFDLGGVAVSVLRMPGHTPGSIGLFVQPHRLLLPADNWNPTTWVFFPECESISTYVRSINSAMAYPFEWALAPHWPALVAGERLRRYAQGLRYDILAAAKPSPGMQKSTIVFCNPEPETTLVFDIEKIGDRW
ncbi:MAG: MBL fold metallo-hydrolase [Oscillospiraceae bacterium]|jgi:glyoxylase-like metal-dependent hydrolase (beta-lactamase superfamily II)|nr:MBL fold metallo-hydrolase [Oscillospiraceae bacterium]